jgi:YVTN family beta-propeller protein
MRLTSAAACAKTNLSKVGEARSHLRERALLFCDLEPQEERGQRLTTRIVKLSRVALLDSCAIRALYGWSGLQVGRTARSRMRHGAPQETLGRVETEWPGHYHVMASVREMCRGLTRSAARRLSVRAALALAVSLVMASACTADPGPAAPTPDEGDPIAPAEPEHRSVVWVAVEGEGVVAEVDVEEQEVLRRIEVPGFPHNLTVARDGTVVAALQRAGTMALVRNGEVIEVLLGGSPHDVKPWNGVIVVANEGDARVDLVSVEGEHLDSVSLKADPHDLAVSPDGREAWVTMNGTDELAVVDVDARAVLRYVPTAQRPHDILFAPDGRIWVTDWGGPVHVFTRDGDLVGSLEIGQEAHHLTFTPDGSEAWVTDHGADEVFVIDSASLQVLASFDLPDPHHVAVTGDGRLAAVADHRSGALAVFDVAERREVATIPVGAGPHGVWAAP